jgi:carbamoyl-phosphate synthase small subunit
MKTAVLTLANGLVLRGEGIGAAKTVHGELVFTTAMTGYDRALTDPSFGGQILIFANPLIGNYGMVQTESPGICAAGVVFKHLSPSSFHRKSTNSLASQLEQEGVPGITGIDTRALVRLIASQGTIGCTLSVSEGEETPIETRLPVLRPFRVAVIDFGLKQAILEELTARGCDLTVLPPRCQAQTILDQHFDGVLLSPGPGDPADLDFTLPEIRQLLGKVPMFGLCMGHELVGLALGGKIVKLPFGHRGCNHAVLDHQTDQVYVTSQNHGYAVDFGSIKSETGVKAWFTNLNDQTNEGLISPELKLMTTQFHPEASPGPQDTRWIFQRFVEMIETNSKY